MQANEQRNLLEQAVDKVQGVAILRPFPAIAGDYGQEVAGGRSGIFVDYLLHALFPFYVQPLAGFAPAVGEHSPAEVFFP